MLYPRWKEALLVDLARREDHPLFALLGLHADPVPDHGCTVPELYQDHTIFDCSNTLAALAGSGISCPAQDRTLFRTWLDHYRRSGYLVP